MKKLILARIVAFFSTLLVFAAFAMLQTTAAQANSNSSLAYRFRLVKGKSVAVCEAYLERLHTTAYQAPPNCDRPENDALTGFARLNRAPLSAEEVHALLPRIKGFTDQKIKICETSRMPEGNAMVCLSLSHYLT